LLRAMCQRKRSCSNRYELRLAHRSIVCLEMHLSHRRSIS
jgi:hypothetical protein